LALGVDDIPQRRRTRMERRTVVRHDGGSRRQRADRPVPHHPTGGRELEHDVAAVDVAVQEVFAQVFQQYAAGAVDDRFRLAGRARREQHVPGMVEREQLELRAWSRRADPRVPFGPYSRGRRGGPDHHAAADAQTLGE
jgi:hypothetical protein